MTTYSLAGATPGTRVQKGATQTDYSSTWPAALSWLDGPSDTTSSVGLLDQLAPKQNTFTHTIFHSQARAS